MDPIDDREIEGDETVTVNLEPGTGYKLGDDRSTSVIIADNDFPIDLESQNLLSIGGNSFSAGDTVSVWFFLKNNERGEAGPFNVAFYLSEDDTITSDDRLLGNYEISQLGGNANTVPLFANFTLPDPGDAFWTGDGNYTIGLWVDSDDAIAESKEHNNVNTGPFKDYINNIQIRDTQLNQAPVTTNDATTIFQGSTATIPVLANDSDPDNDDLIITGVTAASGVTAISNNQITYKPNQGFSGTDSFFYTVSDGQGGIDTGTVNVTVQALPSGRVTVTVHRVLDLDTIDGLSDNFFSFSSGADYFTEISINNGAFWTSPKIENEADIRPNWRWSENVTAVSVPVIIKIFDQDPIWKDHADINPVPGNDNLDLIYNLVTGEISGHASGTRGQQISIQGDRYGKRAIIWFSINHSSL